LKGRGFSRAAHYFDDFMARLKPRPFKAPNAQRVFQQELRSLAVGHEVNEGATEMPPSLKT